MFSCCKVDTVATEAQTDMCPLHPSFHIQKVCIQNRCLEPLCHICQAQHLKIHQMLTTEPKLMNSQIVKHYALEQCQRQIRQLEKTPNIQINRSPKEQIFDMIDQFFLGSTANRLAVLKQREKVLLSRPHIGNVIAILLEQHKYIVPKIFENSLNMFLDKNLIFHNI